MGLLRRKRWDAQPTQQAGVLLASDGRDDFSSGAVATAATLGDQSSTKSVAVIAIAKVYGFSYGLPHPGLMPTKAEAMERTGWVQSAIETLKKSGLASDGQVATTRHGVKMIAKIAQQRNVSHIVVDGAKATGIRRMIEGDVGDELNRRLRGKNIQVVVIQP